MNLVVEIGNTALKAAWSEGITIGRTYRYQGEKELDFILSITEKEKPEIMVIASSSPLPREERDILSGECRRLVVLDSENKEILERNSLPPELSYDRVASIIAGKYLFKGKGCTVFDFGTTLTVDFIDAEGNYKGGAISPGCRTRFKALHRYSRSLPLVETPDSPGVSGYSIHSSIEAGVISGIMFEVNGYLNLHPGNIAVFTGGDANYFAKRMKKPIFAICNLVLMGLALMADEYVKEMDS